MNDTNAQKLLTTVMGWSSLEDVSEHVPKIQLLADYKYDSYQRFSPGRRFVESLANWLNQFESEDREKALKVVLDRLIFISDSEFSHLVQTAYPDWILNERINLVAEEMGMPNCMVGQICSSSRFKEIGIKSLYLGLSDGARTNELRRASGGAISNEQIWQAYELGEQKAKDMIKELEGSLKSAGLYYNQPKFNMIWLLDDFSGSGNTYIRYDSTTKSFKGKIKKIYERLSKGDLVDPSHYEVYLLLYTSTRQAINHIEYWSEQFTTEYGFKPLQLRVIWPLEDELSLSRNAPEDIRSLVENINYYDEKASDKHIKIGGTEDARWGFAACGLPLVLSHNSPNNSLYILWGPDSFKFQGLFPRVSRHREF